MKRKISMGMAMLLLSCLLFVNDTPIIASDINLSNPVIEEDLSADSKQKVTYDTVYFGSYPNREVIAEEYYEYETTVRGEIQEHYIIDRKLYKKLKNSKKWDENGNVVINGEKYKRIKFNDVYKGKSGKNFWNDGHFDWHYTYIETYLEEIDVDTDKYYYFKYEPIKWRVLSIEDDKMLLLSEDVIDGKKYNEMNESYEDYEDYEDYEEDIHWNICTLRSWLNGYTAKSNLSGISYKDDNFIDTAFNRKEKKLLKKIEGDKVSILSLKDLKGDRALSLGFTKKLNKYDEAKRFDSTTYAIAMQVKGTAWVRTKLSSKNDDMLSCGYEYEIESWGRVCNDAHNSSERCGVRPVICIDINNTDSYVVGEKIKTTYHMYEEKITKKATCNKTGRAKYTCSICGDTYRDSLPATHTYTHKVKWAKDKKSAKITFECSKCGDKKIKKAKISTYKTDHHDDTENLHQVNTVYVACARYNGYEAVERKYVVESLDFAGYLWELKNSRDYIKIDYNKANVCDGLIFYRKEGNGKFEQVNIDKSNYEYVDKNVKEGVLYSYYVREVSNYDENTKCWTIKSPKSRTLKIVKLSAPKNIKIEDKGNVVNLKWDKATGATGYRIKCKMYNRDGKRGQRLKEVSINTKRIRKTLQIPEEYEEIHLTVTSIKNVEGKKYYSASSKKFKIFR